MRLSSTASVVSETDASQESGRPENSPPDGLLRREESREAVAGTTREWRSGFVAAVQSSGLFESRAAAQVSGGLAVASGAALPVGEMTPVRPSSGAYVSSDAASMLEIRPRAGLQRAHRVLLLLVVIWGLNAFDLGFTLHQAPSLHFVEMNPLAARLLDAPPAALFTYKFSLVGAGTVILVSLRRHTVSELACWFLLAAYFYVAARWFVYYERALTIPEDALLYLSS